MSAPPLPPEPAPRSPIQKCAVCGGEWDSDQHKAITGDHAYEAAPPEPTAPLPGPSEEPSMQDMQLAVSLFFRAPAPGMGPLNHTPSVREVAQAIARARSEATERAAKDMCFACARPEVFGKAYRDPEARVFWWHSRRGQTSIWGRCDAAPILSRVDDARAIRDGGAE